MAFLLHSGSSGVTSEFHPSGFSWVHSTLSGLSPNSALLSFGGLVVSCLQLFLGSCPHTIAQSVPHSAQEFVEISLITSNEIAFLVMGCTSVLLAYSKLLGPETEFFVYWVFFF